MFLSIIRQRSIVAIMSVLLMIILLPLNLLSSTAFAQTKPSTQCPQKKLCSLTIAAHPDSGGSSSVTLNPSEAPAGAIVMGVGINWASGDTMLVQWEDGTNLANTTVNTDGTFSISFTVPSNATQGTHTVYFTDQTAGYFIPATLTVGTCASSSLTVQSAFTQDGNGNTNQIFTQGSNIHYVVEVNNSCGGTINALFHFQDFWGTINDYPLEIFDNIYQNITLPVGLSGWYVPTTVPTNALPGSFTHEVYVADMNGNQNQGTAYGSFTVTGSLQLPGVKYYTQYAKQYAQNFDCGPSSVAMALTYYGRGPGGSGKALTQIRIAATGKNTRTDTKGRQLETALSHYGSAYYEISQLDTPNPAIQINDIAAAIEQNQPVIAFVNVTYFGRSYAGHWLVVTGFSNDGTNTYVILNDPDNQTKKKGFPNWIVGGPNIPVVLSTFDNAVQYGNGLEPNNIAGIVVTS